MTSYNFLYRVLMVFPLTLLTSLELKIHIPEYLSGLYYINSNILFAIKALISCCWDSLKGLLKVVIMPSCLSFINSSISAYSLLIMKAIGISIPLLIIIMNCSLKSLLIRHLQLQLPLQIIIIG